MKKFFRIAVSCLLAVVMIMAVAGCNKGNKEQIYNPEERPFSMSISTPDGVFNPFFSTSAYDSEVIGLTQISMLGSDKDGNIVCGDNEPVVVKDWTSSEEKDGSGNTIFTNYKFIIKNGIKFSDGSDLTIKDVLFNLYVYLDPVYTGSATIYSTDIVGLKAYRSGQDDITDNEYESQEQGYVQKANKRINDLIEYVQDASKMNSADKPNRRDYDYDRIKSDYRLASDSFRKELESDWASIDLEGYKDWGFTEKWQIFFYQDLGLTEIFKKKPDGTFVKDDDGNYQFDPDNPDVIGYAKDKDEWIRNNIGDIGSMTDVQKEDATRQWAVTTVHENSFLDNLDFNEAEITTNTKPLNYAGIESVCRYWATAETVRSQFVAEARGEDLKDSQIKKVSGITTSKTSVDYHGNQLGAEHDVLEIKINNVDPKAIWNFAFTVAPMNYYSSSNYNGHDYIGEFDFETEFGVARGDIKFFNNVINASNKVGLPKGAGVYMASNSSGNAAKSSDEFFDKNMIYYQRNPYFETLGSGINNAKIKYVRYKVVETDQVINALANGDIDYGDPSATQDNMAALDDSGVAHVEIKTSGYGYVGINPRFVPDITVRRAIMRAMDTSIITNNYYKGGLAELIYRPMSNTSWAYPKGCTVYTNESKGLNYAHDATTREIKKMIEVAGYTENASGIYEKNGERLEYTFTIAGSSQDHPAYAMFLHARDILQAVGFKIKVTTSTTALSDLASGKLAVWAAAWSSTIDPDMYQIYHKDSKATSVKNWGYPQILNNTEKYSEEYRIILELSDLIDEGRETTVQSERTKTYHEALDLIMELAVEMPTYQRRDMYAFNSKVLDVNTMTPETERSSYNGLISRMWELNYN